MNNDDIINRIKKLVRDVEKLTDSISKENQVSAPLVITALGAHISNLSRLIGELKDIKNEIRTTIPREQE